MTEGWPPDDNEIKKIGSSFGRMFDQIRADERSKVLKEMGAWLEGNCTKGHNDYGGFVNQPKKRRDCEGCRQSLLRGEKP